MLSEPQIHQINQITQNGRGDCVPAIAWYEKNCARHVDSIKMQERNFPWHEDSIKVREMIFLQSNCSASS